MNSIAYFTTHENNVVDVEIKKYESNLEPIKFQFEVIDKTNVVDELIGAICNKLKYNTHLQGLVSNTVLSIFCLNIYVRMSSSNRQLKEELSKYGITLN